MEHFLIMWAPWIVIVLSVLALFGWGAKGDTK
ncbi:cytochrome bd oxidase small subunit CydS [Alkalihalobacillus sp. CinArs1]